ncbi:MAG TPA: hypothetical protein VLG08_08360 [Casimicrobiaceae bacterium]|jgi:hypothetical protein|nr:hypothetical protein [Casimicrobiaceae bacterium]
MCYEFESWHWKARAKEMHKAQSKPSAVEEKREPETASPPTMRVRPQAKPTEKMPA